MTTSRSWTRPTSVWPRRSCCAGTTSTRTSACGCETLIAARHWLTVVRLPAYAPDLNPTEGVWSWTKRGIANTAIHGVDHLADLVKQRLRACQQQTNLIAGFLTQTGMTIGPEHHRQRDRKPDQTNLPWSW
jgi:hypothetical protein